MGALRKFSVQEIRSGPPAILTIPDAPPALPNICFASRNHAAKMLGFPVSTREVPVIHELDCMMLCSDLSSAREEA